MTAARVAFAKGFSAREGSGVFSTFFFVAHSDTLWVRQGFSAREGSGVFSTVIELWKAGQEWPSVSAPVRALGSFLPIVLISTPEITSTGFSAREGSGVFSTARSCSISPPFCRRQAHEWPKSGLFVPFHTKSPLIPSKSALASIAIASKTGPMLAWSTLQLAGKVVFRPVFGPLHRPSCEHRRKCPHPPRCSQGEPGW